MIRRTKKLGVKGPSQASVPVVDLYPISAKVSGGLGKQGTTQGYYGAPAAPMPTTGQPAYF